MKNNIIGFVTYLLATIFFSVGRCHLTRNERKFRQMPLLWRKMEYDRYSPRTSGNHYWSGYKILF